MDAHYQRLVKAIVDGRVVPFLGAGVNLLGRSNGIAWMHGNFDCLPNGRELAAHLAKTFDYPLGRSLISCPHCKSAMHLIEEPEDPIRVSQYVAVMTGTGPLYEKLRTVFDGDFPPTPLHDLLASLPSILREKGLPQRYQLIVTTNYDDVLERAFRAVGEPFDLVTYVADGVGRGKFLHSSPSGDTHLVEIPNEYRGLSLDQRTVILKVHGAVDRVNPDRDSFVITEDHYIDYLSRSDISSLVPLPLPGKLRKSHFPFLGYSLRDWNVRVILYRIWGEQKLTFKSWAVQLNPQPIEIEYWSKRGVQILANRLEDYVTGLKERLQALPSAKDTA